MATLYVTEVSRGRGFMTGPSLGGEASIRFQGDIGYGVYSEAQALRNERARKRELPIVLGGEP